jgi:glutaredoxin
MDVSVYTASGCHLCEAALDVVEGVRRDIEFELRVVDIGGDPALEAAYRELLPVVEIDGERAFTWFVDPEALRDRLLRPGAAGSGTM